MIVSKALSQIEPKKKRSLDPETKYQIFIEAARGDIPHADVLRKWVRQGGNSEKHIKNFFGNIIYNLNIRL